MYPFSVKFRKKIKNESSELTVDNLILHFENEFKDESANFFTGSGNRLEYHNRLKLFEWNWNIMLPIDNGFIEIETIKENEFKITYGITFIRLFVISILLGLIVGLTTREFITGLTVFGIAFILNSVFVVVRHYGLLTDIVNRYMKSLDKK